VIFFTLMIMTSCDDHNNCCHKFSYKYQDTTMHNQGCNTNADTDHVQTVL